MTFVEALMFDEVRGQSRRPSVFLLLIRQAAALCIVLLAVHCNSVPPEQRLRATIATGIEAAEHNDPDELADLVSTRYSDARGRDRQALLNLVRGYLSQMGPLHIFTIEKSLVITSSGRAEVTLLVAVASVPMESLADLRESTADLGRVELTFAEEGGDWKLLGVGWSRAEVTDFF